MQRISIMGNAAGGKSTLAHAISDSFSLPYYEIDKIMWGDNWKIRPLDLIASEHDEIIYKASWVLDGMTHHELTEKRLARADTVILIDQPFALHKTMALRRLDNWDNLEFKPANQPFAPAVDKLIDMLNYVDSDIMPIVRNLINQFEQSGKKVHRLSSFEEINIFKSSYL